MIHTDTTPTSIMEMPLIIPSSIRQVARSELRRSTGRRRCQWPA